MRALRLTLSIAGGLAALAIAGLAGLLVFGTAAQPPELRSIDEPLQHVDYSDLPPLQHFAARDGAELSYRAYPGSGKDTMVLIHGSSGESTSVHALAKAIRAAGYTVYVPDLRGHGHDGRPGDIDYAGQLDDDLADLVALIRRTHPEGALILAGHSLGGGYVLRIAEGPEAHLFARFILLAPALPYGAETNRPDGGGWAKVYVGRIIALQILNRLGIHMLNGLTVVAFAIPRTAPVPLVATYSFRMVANFGAPQGAVARLAAVKEPLAVLVGSADELFYPDRFQPLIDGARPDVPVTIVPGANHIGLITDPRALAAIVGALSN